MFGRHQEVLKQRSNCHKSVRFVIYCHAYGLKAFSVLFKAYLVTISNALLGTCHCRKYNKEAWKLRFGHNGQKGHKNLARNLVRSLAKNLAKKLAKNLARNLARNLEINFSKYRGSPQKSLLWSPLYADMAYLCTCKREILLVVGSNPKPIKRGGMMVWHKIL